MARDSHNPEKFGHPIPHDPDFRGPQKHRSCTDVLFLLLFLVFVGCWIGIGIYAFRNGDPSSILIPKDSNGLRCGKDSTVINKPHLLFFDLTKCISPSVPFKGCNTPQVCVEKCPDHLFYGKDTDTDKSDYICRDSAVKKIADGKNCAQWYLPSTSVQGRCLPILSKENIQWLLDNNVPEANDISKAVSNVKLISETEQVGQNIVNDLIDSWHKILVGMLIALLITLIYLMLLRWTAGVMVWVSTIGVIVALGFGIYGSYVKYKQMLDEEKELDYVSVESFHNTKKYLWLAALIIFSVSFVIILLTTIFLRKRINLAITLIEEGSKAISSVISVLVFPIFPWVLQIGVIVYAIATALLLTTTGVPLFKVKRYENDTIITSDCSELLNEKCDPETFNRPECPDLTCHLIKMDHNGLYDYMQWFNVFGFFWGTFFVSAFGQMVLACIFATWYWSRPRSKQPFFAVTSSTLTVIRYHLGTIAFGSLIIAICRMIRVVLEYIDHKLKKYENSVTKALMCLLKCFFWCLEKFLKFINTNAYIMCSIHGRNFCTSARDAFMLLMRNIIRVFVLDKVTDFLFFISSILISIGVGILAYFFFTTDKVSFIDNSNLTYPEVPIVVIVVCTYFISTIFFNIYSMAVDTLFLCFLEDCERNDGSAEKPYFMSKDLMKIFGKKNKVE